MGADGLAARIEEPSWGRLGFAAGQLRGAGQERLIGLQRSVLRGVGVRELSRRLGHRSVLASVIGSEHERAEGVQGEARLIASGCGLQEREFAGPSELCVRLVLPGPA